MSDAPADEARDPAAPADDAAAKPPATVPTTKPDGVPVKVDDAKVEAATEPADVTPPPPPVDAPASAAVEPETDAKAEAPAAAEPAAEAKTETPAPQSVASTEGKSEASAEPLRDEAPAADAKAAAPAPPAATTVQDGTDLAVVAKPRPKVTVRLAGMTDVGRIREHNEDNLLVADLSARSRDASLFDTTLDVGEQGLLLAVCDGMGGALAGEVASKMAVDVIHGIVQDAGVARDGDHFAQKLVGAVQEAGARIYLAAKTNRNQHGMGTTATVAGVFGGQLFVGQVGDSRAYVLRGGRLRQITKDQSLVSKLIEAGQLTEEEAESYEHAHIILQALGTSDAVCVDLSYVDLRRGDVLMLCSDGLSGLATTEQIHEILSSGDEPLRCARRLIDSANEAGGHDNITVIVARFEGELAEVGDDDALLGYQAHVLSQPVEALVGGRASTTMKVPDLPPPGADMKHRVSIPPGEQSLPKYDDGDDDDDDVEDVASARVSARPGRGDDERVAVPMESSPWPKVVLVAVLIGVIIGLWLALRAPADTSPRALPEAADAGAPETPVSPGLPVEPTAVPAPAWGDASTPDDR